MTLQKEKGKTKQHTRKYDIPFLYEVEADQLISPANYSVHAGNVERVHAYARKHLELGVTGERYKPVCSVDRLKSKCLVINSNRGGYTHTYNGVSLVQ